MKKLFSLILTFVVALSCMMFTACGSDSIMIYTSTEDYNMEYLRECLKEEFPDYDIKVIYMGTSNITAKILNEGISTDCDIVFFHEYGYLEQMANENLLADISERYDYSIYNEDTIQTAAINYLLPIVKTGGGIIVNNNVLTEKGLSKPTSYQDLLDGKYKGWISMPSPKMSGTGYMFYLSLVNAWGETTALDYFDDLNDNISNWESSGSSPVNKLVQGEVAVGFGMLTQAAFEISDGNTDLEILFFEEGAPFNLYGNSVIKGKEEDEKVMAVMDYIYSEYTELCNERYYPETVLKDKTFTVANYPMGIKYADMSGNTIETKEGLLDKWKH